jgi:hypothetical protein
MGVNGVNLAKSHGASSHLYEGLTYGSRLTRRADDPMSLIGWSST